MPGSDLKQILVNFDVDIFFTNETTFYHFSRLVISHVLFLDKGEFALSIA